MREPKIIKPRDIIPYPHMKVIMRKDFYADFESQLKKVEEDTGAIFFGHNIIKNYMEPGHKVSTFCNYEEWQDFYWEKHCYTDPLEKIIHKAVQKNDFGVVSWELGHNGSLCSQDRTKITQVKDGITFSFKRQENYIENLNIGWKDLDPETLDIEYISYLTSLLKPLRDYHWEVHNKI